MVKGREAYRKNFLYAKEQTRRKKELEKKMEGGEVNFKMTILDIISEMRRNGILEIQGCSKKE